MPKRILELFSGTCSIGKVVTARASKLDWEIVSLDRDMKSVFQDNDKHTHIMEDIMDWDYTIYPPKYFDVITASPVCLYWSCLRCCNFGREIKAHPNVIFTRELLEEDINKYGKPMVDKVREILDYFKPTWWWIENPQTGRMKSYITDLPYYDVDYCKYGFLYKKRTRFWTNIKGFEPKRCKKDCEHILTTEDGRKIHPKNCGNTKYNEIARKISHKSGATDTLERYRIPESLIQELLELCKFD